MIIPPNPINKAEKLFLIFFLIMLAVFAYGLLEINYADIVAGFLGAWFELMFLAEEDKKRFFVERVYQAGLLR